MSSKNEVFKIVVLVSGSGSNLQALLDAQDKIGIKIQGVISNKKDAYALVRAQNCGINTAFFDKDEHGKALTREAFEKKALAQIDAWGADLVVLAGFMRVLTDVFINGVYGKNIAMINLHPSILPAYKGLDTHARVLAAGDVWHGCSVHLVSQELDSGRLLAQSKLQVLPSDTSESLQARVHQLEHKILPFVVYLFASKQLLWNGSLINQMPLNLPISLYFDVD